MVTVDDPETTVKSSVGTKTGRLSCNKRNSAELALQRFRLSSTAAKTKRSRCTGLRGRIARRHLPPSLVFAGTFVALKNGAIHLGMTGISPEIDADRVILREEQNYGGLSLLSAQASPLGRALCSNFPF